jgi:DNA-binding transcriptional ArsR family regulator
MSIGTPPIYALTDIFPLGNTYRMPPNTMMEVIAEPSRRRILDALAGGEQPVKVLVERLAMSQPMVSKHLRVLRDAELVEVRAEGQQRIYRVCPEPLMELDHWLEPYRQMWRESLDRLAEHLDHHERPTTTRRRKR